MNPKLVGWMMSAIVLLLIFVTVAILQNPIRLLITGKRAKGLVVGMDTSSRLSNSSEAGPVQAPIVEFVTSAGERVSVSGRDYSASASLGIGETVNVAYSESDPRDAQFLIVKEFPIGITGFMLGFIAFVLLLWISCILISQEPAYGDPLKILPTLITRFQLNPVRFPIFYILSMVIPLCGLTSYIFFSQAITLRSNGIKVMGHVVETRWENSRLNDKSEAGGSFPVISYKDLAGERHIIKRSLAKPFSRLQISDRVEVIYPVGAPDKGIVNTWDEFYLIPVFFGSMMIAFLFLFRFVWRGSIRN